MQDNVFGDGALGALLPEEATPEIYKWRRRFPGIRADLGPPHITIAYPPFIRANDWPQMRPAVVECLGVFEPFGVTLREVGTFTEEDLVLWLKPEDGGALFRIRDALAERFPEYVSPSADNYVPHVTVSFFDSQEAQTQAQQAISSGLETIEFRIHELEYIVLGHDNAWHHQDSIPLGKSTRA